VVSRETRSDLEPDPIVLYGAPRSGTTYLQQLLNSHPDVFVSHEARIFGWLYHALEVLPEDERFLVTYHDAFVEYLREHLPDVMRDFYRALAPDARFWGDKNPHYAEARSGRCLEMVSELFPTSLFIHIIRDGRDVVSSLVRKRIMAQEERGEVWERKGEPWVTFEGAHHTWNRIVDRGSDFGRALPEHRYFELRYEDLVRDDLGMAEQLFGFLGIEVDPAAEAFCRRQQQDRTPFKDPMRDLNQGILASDWPTIFSSDERSRSLQLLGENLVRFGYETEESLELLREQVVAN
jgi:hypothetical protein